MNMHKSILKKLSLFLIVVFSACSYPRTEVENFLHIQSPKTEVENDGLFILDTLLKSKAIAQLQFDSIDEKISFLISEEQLFTVNTKPSSIFIMDALQRITFLDEGKMIYLTFLYENGNAWIWESTEPLSISNWVKINDLYYLDVLSRFSKQFIILKLDTNQRISIPYNFFQDPTDDNCLPSFEWVISNIDNITKNDTYSIKDQNCSYKIERQMIKHFLFQ